jgi:hypothetical protein
MLLGRAQAKREERDDQEAKHDDPDTDPTAG